MATATFELYDGSTTLDLLGGTPYSAQINPGISIPRPPSTPTISANTLAALSNQPRTITTAVKVTGTSQSDLTTQIRALELMLARAKRRQLIGESSTKVVLRYQQGNTDANDIELVVITGGFSAPPHVFDETRVATSFVITGTLTLICEPFGELADITLGRKLLGQEIDLPSINYFDITDEWGGGFDFDGRDTSVACGSDSSIDNIFNGGGYIGVRLLPGGDSDGNIGNVVAKHNGSSGWVFQINDSGDIRFEVEHSTTDGVWTATGAVTIGREYFIELGYNDDSVSNDPVLKVDGATVSMTETVTPVGTYQSDAALNLEIGSSNGGGTNNWDGTIWEVRLYDANSITDSITQEANGNETSLVALYRFEEQSGTSLTDLSSNTNTGTVTAGVGDWTIDSDLKGDAGGLLQLRLEDVANTAWTAGKTMYVGLRSGERRTDTLFDQIPNSVTDVDDDILGGAETSTKGTTGGPTANTSGGTSAFFRTRADATSSVQQGFTIRGYSTFTQPGASLPRGLFRVLARCQIIETAVSAGFDIAEFGFALSYSFGGKTTTPIAGGLVAPSATSEWQLLDLGELSIPPIATPDGFTAPDMDIRVNAVMNVDSAWNMQSPEYIEWSCDHIFLLPIDEGAFIVSSVDATDEIIADLISDPPGIWLASTSSVIQEIASSNGAPLQLGPEATRIHIIKDDPGDPSTVQTYAYPKFTPLVSGI